ncbi:MAG TPA: hypothetical protein VGG10_10205, partial [Rhizomicrobium sp.]
MTKNWLNDTDGEWTTPGNWSGGTVPSSSDDVVINTADFHTIDYSNSGNTVTVNSLSVGNDAFTATAGTLIVSNAATFANTLKVQNAVLTLDGTSSVTGLYTQLNGTLGGPGTVTLAGGAAFTGGQMLMSGSGTAVLQGASTLTSGGIFLDGGYVLENQGTFTESQTTSITLGENPAGGTLGGGKLQNDASGTIVFNNTSTDTALSANSGTVSFTNAGAVQNTGLGGDTRINVTFTDTGSGSVSVMAGEFDLNGGGSSSATAFSVASGTTLGFNANGSGDTFTLSGGTSAGAGTVFLESGELSITGATTIENLFKQTGGEVAGATTFTLAGGAQFAGGSMLMTGTGTTVLEGTSTLSSGALDIDGGYVLENKGTFTENGSVSINLGENPFSTSLGGGTLKNDAGATIIFNNAFNDTAVQ